MLKEGAYNRENSKNWFYRRRQYGYCDYPRNDRKGRLSAGVNFCFDLNPLQLEKIGELGVQAMASAVEIVKAVRCCFWRVKPQSYEEVLTGIRQAVAPEKIFVTIAAGISTEYIMNTLGIPCPVVRAMPNTPLLLGKGATALCKGLKCYGSGFPYGVGYLRRFGRCSGFNRG